MRTDLNEVVKYLNQSINANNFEKFNSLLDEHSAVLAKEQTVHSLYSITVNIAKKVKHFKPYIDSLYQHGLSLDFKKTKKECYTYDILTCLLYAKKPEIVDYIIEEYKYPKEFYGIKNYLAEIILYRKINDVSKLLSKGLISPSYQTAFDFINPDNFSKSIKQIHLLQKEKCISSDNNQIFASIFFNNNNSFSMDNLKKIFKLFSPDLSSSYFSNLPQEKPFFIKNIMDDYNKIELLEEHGFSLKDFLSKADDKVLVDISITLINYFEKMKIDNSEKDIAYYLDNNDCYKFFANIKHPDVVIAHMVNFQNHFTDFHDHSYINIPAILKLFNFDSHYCSKDEFHDFLGQKFNLLYNTADEMWNISEIYKKDKIQYEKKTLQSILDQNNSVPLIQSNKKRL